MREAYPNELMHFGILGMRWGVRRYQTASGALTRAGIERYRKKAYKQDRDDEADFRYREQERKLSIQKQKEDARQTRTERRLENQRKRLENRRAALENRDYAKAIATGKSTKSYRDQAIEKTEAKKSEGGKQETKHIETQNNSIINVRPQDIPNLNYQDFNNQDLQNLVNRLGNQQKLDEIYKKSIPPTKAEKATAFVQKNGKALDDILKIVVGVGTSAAAIYGWTKLAGKGGKSNNSKNK